MADSSQKFISRNRAPRVQIEYEVELYGAEKKIQLPFVMGVMSDLSGRSEEPQPPLEDRKFLEIDADNFDSRMRSIKPRAAFSVPNTLTGEGNLAVDITFESMDDFAPAAIAGKVEPLRKLLEARTRLSDLMTYMDGKSGAEDLILKLMQDPAMLQALSASNGDGADHKAALEALRDAAPDEVSPASDTDDALQSLRAMAPVETDTPDPVDAALEGLRRTAPEDDPGAEDTHSSALDDLRGSYAEDTSKENDTSEAVLETLRDAAPDEPEESDDVRAALDGLRSAASDDMPVEDTSEAVLDALRDSAPDEPEKVDAVAEALDTLRSVAPDDVPAVDTDEAALDRLREAASDDLPAKDRTDDVLAALSEAPPQSEAVDEAALEEAPSDLEAVQDEAEAPPGDEIVSGMEAETDDLAKLPGSGNDAAGAGGNIDPADELDDLLTDSEEDISGSSPEEDSSASMAATPAAVPPDNPDEDDLGLDDLLADLDDPADQPEVDAVEDMQSTMPDAGTAVELPDDPGPLDDANELPDGHLSSEPPVKAAVSLAGGAFSFGTLSAPRPERAAVTEDKFRIAIFGDFTGRAARGVLEIGDGLANRRPIRLDIDKLEDVIEGFATTLVLPIGKDGAGIEVKLAELDDLHPDELYENVEIFAELSGLRQRLQMGSMAPAAIAELQGWGEEFGGLNLGSHRASSGSAVPADRPISAFADLIGDVEGRLTKPSPASDLIARIVAPHVVAAENAETPAMIAAVDDALSQAMRLILHNPEFQSVESQWRTLDMLARRIETDGSLELVLYDISAEELAADLAAQEDLSQSGLLHLLTEALEERGETGFSALFGLYSFEETPPHAELLARVARIAAHVNAPFFTSISPAFLNTPKADRHKLVAEAWEKLRDLPEAKYLGLASPRFLLRRPYGARSEPIDAFAFEEFTLGEGLRGMLWANPVVLVAIVLAATRKKDGKAMQLGDIMSIGDIPFHYITDEYGDQVALPCTERNLTTQKMEMAVTRGLMPVLSIRGRDEIRLGSFQAVGRGEILGPWSGAADIPPPSPPPEPEPLEEPDPVSESAPEPDPTPEPEVPTEPEIDVEKAAPEPDAPEPDAPEPDAPEPDAPEAAEDDLDALLASFGEDDLEQDPGEMDAELAALLEDL